MSNIININDAKIAKNIGGKIENIKDAEKKDHRVVDALDQIERDPSLIIAPTGTEPDDLVWTDEKRDDLAKAFRDFYDKKKK